MRLSSGKSSISDIRIADTLVTDGGFRPVTGQDDCIGIKGENFAANPLQQKRAIATGQIPTSHTLPEKHVATDKCFQFGKVKTQTPGTMAGNMKNLHRVSPHPGDHALFHQQIVGNRLELDIETVFFEK